MKVRASLLGFLLAAVSGASCACSCNGSLPALRTYANPLRDGHIFRGRVIRVLSPGRADAQVLTSFRGTKKVEALYSTGDAQGNDCGVAFTLGEEFVYITSRYSFVSMCSRYQATPEMLERMRWIATNSPRASGAEYRDAMATMGRRLAVLKAKGRELLAADSSSGWPPEELRRNAAENAAAIARTEAVLADLEVEARQAARQ